MQPNTITRREYKDEIYVKNIRKNACRIRVRIGFNPKLIEKFDPDTDPKLIEK
jgi:hypothetical protein